MKKLTTVIVVLSMVLGSVALVAATDLPQTSDNVLLSTLQKISDQEAQQIRGTGITGQPHFGGFSGSGNPACPQNLTTVLNPLQTQIKQQLKLKDGSCLQ